MSGVRRRGRRGGIQGRRGGHVVAVLLAAALAACGGPVGGTDPGGTAGQDAGGSSGAPAGTAGDGEEPVTVLGAVEQVHLLATGAVEEPILAVDPRDGTVYAVWADRGPEDEAAVDHDDHADHAGHAGHADHADHAGHDHAGHPPAADEEPAPRIMIGVSHDSGRSFSEPVRVDGPDPVEGFTAAPRGDMPIQVVVTPDGAIHVVWAATRPVEGRPRPMVDLRIATSRDGGGSFEPPRQIVPEEQAAAWSPSFHQAVVAPDGALHVAFLATPEEPDTVGRSVRVVTSRDGGRSFEVGEALTTSTCQCCPVAISARDDRLALAWRHIFPQGEDTPIRDVAIAFSHDGGASWSEIERVHEDGWLMDGCPHTGPVLATGPDGQLHVAWYTGAEGAAGVRYTREEEPERFGDALQLLADDHVPVTQPGIAVTPAGTAWVVWNDLREEEPEVRVARIGADGGLLDVDTVAVGRHPRIVASGEHVLVAWVGASGIEVALLAEGAGA